MSYTTKIANYDGTADEVTIEHNSVASVVEWNNVSTDTNGLRSPRREFTRTFWKTDSDAPRPVQESRNAVDSWTKSARDEAEEYRNVLIESLSRTGHRI